MMVIFYISIVVVRVERHSTRPLAMDQPKFFTDRMFTFALRRDGDRVISYRVLSVVTDSIMATTISGFGSMQMDKEQLLADTSWIHL